jgi:hypothetical protein
MMNKTVAVGLALVLGMCGAVVFAPSVGWAADNDPWQQVLKREFGTCDEAMKAIREQVEPATADQKPALEGKLIAYLLKRPLKWDPVNEEFPGDEQANRFVSRAKREPWAL